MNEPILKRLHLQYEYRANEKSKNYIEITAICRNKLRVQGQVGGTNKDIVINTDSFNNGLNCTYLYNTW
jgi:hypothetical protein